MNRSDLFEPQHVKNEWRKGRNLYDGYARGLTLWGNEAGWNAAMRDEHFQDAIKLANNRSLVGPANFANFLLLMKFYLPQLLAGRPAAIVEFGVARGGCLLFLAALARWLLPGSCRVFGFDTFEGIPPGGADATADWHQVGEFNELADYANLNTIARALGNIELVKGRFEDTTIPPLGLEQPIALCHIDCDTRDSVALAFEATRPYMLPGGYWVFDDPLHASCIGAMEAVEDVVIRGAGLSCEQNYPHLVFRAPL